MKILSKLKNSNRGMSLTELIVASILVGIVMLGVISFSSTMKSVQGSATNSTIPSVKLSSVMFEISKDASLAIGDETDTGIEWDDVGPDLSLCFRHDDMSNDSPDDYSDDTWICYLMDNTNTLHKCTDADFANCQDGTTTPEFSNLITLTQNSFFTVEETGTRIQNILIQLTTRNNPTAAVHPIDNPEFSLETRVSPMALGR